MEVRAITHDNADLETPDRVVELELSAKTFEDERCLAHLLEAISNGGRVTIESEAARYQQSFSNGQ